MTELSPSNIVIFPVHDEVKLLQKIKLCVDSCIKTEIGICSEECRKTSDFVSDLSCFTLNDLLEFRKGWKKELIYNRVRADEYVDAVTAIAFAKMLYCK